MSKFLKLNPFTEILDSSSTGLKIGRLGDVHGSKKDPKKFFLNKRKEYKREEYNKNLFVLVTLLKLRPVGLEGFTGIEN